MGVVALLIILLSEVFEHAFDNFFAAVLPIICCYLLKSNLCLFFVGLQRK